MAKKKKTVVELRFYEVPQGEQVLALLGKEWERVYGHEEFALHFHNLTEIGVCRRGAGDLYYGDKRMRYRDHAVSVIPENFPHTTISDGEQKNFWEYLFFDAKQLVGEMYPDNQVLQAEALAAVNKSPRLLFAGEQEQLYGIVSAVMEEARKQKKYSRQMINLYLKAMMLELMRISDGAAIGEAAVDIVSGGGKIGAALDYTARHYGAPIKVKELAETCGMSEAHFRRVFEEQIHMPPTDYVNLVRIQKACDLMRRSDASMEQIAVKCGFTTTSTFNRNFKKLLGTSPYQWKINPENYESKLLNYNITALKGW